MVSITSFGFDVTFVSDDDLTIDDESPPSDKSYLRQ